MANLRKAMVNLHHKLDTHEQVDIIPFEEFVKEINKHAVMLEKLIEDMLDAQKLDMDKMTLNMEEFSVNEFIADLQTDLKPLMEDKHIEFAVSSDDVSIKGDTMRLGQVISNLVKNAVDFVSQKGKIEINVKNMDDTLLFTVKDNGRGIPKDKQKEIFQKFYQADTSISRKHGGTGLGLSISKEIIEQLGGRIWFESEPEKGTSFYFKLPKNRK